MLVGSGDRSRESEHTIILKAESQIIGSTLTQYNLAEFMEGDLDTMIDTLIQENAAKQMANWMIEQSSLRNAESLIRLELKNFHLYQCSQTGSRSAFIKFT